MCVQDPLEVCHAKLQIQPSSWLLQVCLATMSGEPLTIQHKDGYSAIDIDTDRLVPLIGHTSRSTHTGKLRRLVKRSDGRSRLKPIGIALRGVGFVTDGFTTLLNAEWYWVIPIFCALYILSWLVFAGIWTAVAYTNGQYNGTCVVGVVDFSTAFLFSIETQTTIGFGNKYVTGSCTGGIFVIVLQSLLGLFLDSLLLGMIFVKLTRPRNRRKTMVFSKIAVIYEKDGQKVLEFRVGDLRRSQIVECHVRLQLYWYKEVNSQREFHQYDLDVGYDTGRDRVFLLAPVSVYHYITETSPLYGITEEELSTQDIELVVILEGIVEVTSLTVQALWSYTKDEIQFNRKFLPVVSRRERGKWVADFDKLDSTVCVEQDHQQVEPL